MQSDQNHMFLLHKDQDIIESKLLIFGQWLGIVRALLLKLCAPEKELASSWELQLRKLYRQELLCATTTIWAVVRNTQMQDAGGLQDDDLSLLLQVQLSIRVDGNAS
jgi:hypothetical protein